MDKRTMIINNKLKELSRSRFRNSFHLRKYMINYIDEKGLEKIYEHAILFVEEKLAPANPKNDGKQTPTKNHPVFIAMHACATCCRGCLEKWHKIPKGRELTPKEKNYIVSIIMSWIIKEIKDYKKEENNEKSNKRI